MTPLLIGVSVAGLAIAVASASALVASGARPGLARRLAGPREVSVGSLAAGELPDRPIRVAGRIRCPDPLRAEGGERLVTLHRDVELLIGGRWRAIERVRETRSFELWDRDASLAIDPARAAEPLVVIPKVWRGPVAELEEPLASVARRLAEVDPAPREARSVARSLNVTDRLLVLARARRDDRGAVRLEPPPGGYVITNLDLDDAMRVLGGRHRRLAALAVLGIGVGTAMAVAAGVAALLVAALG